MNVFKLCAYKLILILLLSTNIALAQVPSNAADMAYANAEQLFLRDNLEETLRQLSVFFTKFETQSTPGTLAKARNLKGLTLQQLNNVPAALLEFQKSVEIAEQHFPANDQGLHLARYNLANALLQDKQAEAANNVLVRIDPAALDIDTRVRYYHLLGRTLESLENYPASVVAYLLTANELEARDSVAAESLARRAYALSKKLFLNSNDTDITRLETFEGKMRSDAIGTWTMRIILARGYMFSGRREKALSLLKDFLDEPTNHPLESEARRLVRLMQKLAVVNPSRIGILLPLSGRFQKYGRLSLMAAMLAQKNYLKSRETSGIADTEIEFVIRDSGSTEDSAKAAFEKLATEDHVIGIIGPLLKRQAVEVGRLAQEYGIPLFSLSRSEALNELGSYIFPFALTPEQQVGTLLDYLMGEKGFKRFAILAPDNSGAKDYVDIFWDEVEKRGGSVRGYEEYDSGSTDFRFSLKKLLGLYYEDARSLEKEELKRREEIYASTLKVGGNLRERLLNTYKLQPMVDFDAVFVPDGPKAIGQIAPSFAVYGVKNLPFVGINTWNTMEIVSRAGPYLQRSFFVDTFHSQSKRPDAKRFISEFKGNFGSAPGTLEVQAYDATRILLNAIYSGEVNSRADLRNQIRSNQALRGISGVFKFNDKGAQRSTYLLGVKGTEIEEIQHKNL